jgi:Domain of unknown function (DUF4190)/Protein of unknown function (DUF2510)
MRFRDYLRAMTSDDDSARLPPPGYYPDPAVPGTHRYWDGSSWAAVAAPAPVSVGPPVVGVAPGTNGMAVASMVLGIVWLNGIGSVLAVIFGHLSLGQLSRPDNHQGGRRMAVAGLVLGYVGIVLTALLFVVFVIAAEPGP